MSSPELFSWLYTVTPTPGHWTCSCQDHFQLSGQCTVCARFSMCSWCLLYLCRAFSCTVQVMSTGISNHARNCCLPPQKNPGAIRHPEEEKPREEIELDLMVSLDQAGVLSHHVGHLCQAAGSSVFARDADLKVISKSEWSLCMTAVGMVKKGICKWPCAIMVNSIIQASDKCIFWDSNESVKEIIMEPH